MCLACMVMSQRVCGCMSGGRGGLWDCVCHVSACGHTEVDVIDTTFMQQNVHMLRHSYWNLNQEIIEDLRYVCTCQSVWGVPHCGQLVGFMNHLNKLRSVSAKSRVSESG
eukprot:GHVU01046936.1.p1 GENE.GHVU01046936.1~~GHVU01046936.1.p1  ORF type:complete len:110 (-),score=2.58 GHVU01046936.1:406-735(-)